MRRWQRKMRLDDSEKIDGSSDQSGGLGWVGGRREGEGPRKFA